MKSNEIIKQIHSEIVRKVAKSCKLEGNGKLAAEIGTALIEYGKTWTEGLANDGEIDFNEVERISNAFGQMIDKYVPEVDNFAIGIAYNGIWPFWGGLKKKLNKWFGLNLV